MFAIKQAMTDKIRVAASTIKDTDVPGFRLHPLGGDQAGRWSIWINANWRLTFEFREGRAYLLDYEDYH